MTPGRNGRQCEWPQLFSQISSAWGQIDPARGLRRRVYRQYCRFVYVISSYDMHVISPSPLTDAQCICLRVALQEAQAQRQGSASAGLASSKLLSSAVSRSNQQQSAQSVRTLRGSHRMLAVEAGNPDRGPLCAAIKIVVCWLARSRGALSARIHAFPCAIISAL